MKYFLSQRVKIVCFLLFLLLCFNWNPNYASSLPPDWESIRKVKMKGDIKVFWHVSSYSQANSDQAVKHGFQLAYGLNPFADYPGKQRENIDDFLKANQNNPWLKPSFFERVVKRNLINFNSRGSIFVNDIETGLNGNNVRQAWKNQAIRSSARAKNFDDFEEKYYSEAATWFQLPCQWFKQIHPHTPVGIYGLQVFNRDYLGFFRSLQDFKDNHSRDLKIWKHVDPYVDFYTASTYVFYEKPDSIYYIAANIEENYYRSRKFSNKPLYNYFWPRYLGSQYRQKELANYIVEASAVIPFFSGAKGIVLYGSEPKSKSQPYYTLPVFMNSLSRVSDLSEKISRAELIVDRSAAESWREKLPLVRKLKVSDNEWILMAIYPWQNEHDSKILTTNCGNKIVKLEIRGKHTEIYHLQNGILKKLSVS